jgi:hypothetical protein
MCDPRIGCCGLDVAALDVPPLGGHAHLRHAQIDVTMNV